MEWAGAAFTLLSLPVLTICIIVITVEASSAKHLINVNCVRSKRRFHSVTAGAFTKCYECDSKSENRL